MGLNDFLKKIFGNKSQRDLKEIQPYVDKINAIYPEIAALSNDELRNRTQAVMQRLQEAVAAEREQIAKLKEGIEDMEVEAREKNWAEIDRLEKAIVDKYEEVLEAAIPEVFSIVKNTGLRFTNADEIEVTATDFDRELAVTKDFVRIEGDKAIYSTTWKAGGNDMRWGMTH
ncbi:MAG: preprotein translocase subunit SecA, partial [Bacteroidales bacterium]